MPDIPIQYDSESLPKGVLTPVCPPLGLLRASREGALPSELAHDVASHIDSCDLCQILLADLEHVPQPSLTNAERDRILNKLPILVPPKTSWSWYAVSAAAVALVVAGIFFLRRPAQMPPFQSVAQTQPSTPSTPANQPAPSPLQIAKLAPPLDLSPQLVLRGESSASQPTAQQFEPAFAAYTQGDYPVAEQRFRILAQQFPRSETPFLYLGVTELLENNSQAALPNLSRAESLARQNNGSQRNDAAWYHALAAVAQRSPDAGTLVENVCFRKSSPYSQQACQLKASIK